MRSVWSRESIRPPMSEGPCARSAARTSALFTWALATGRSQASGCRLPDPGRNTSGASVPPARASMRAPIARRGSTTRAMGRPTSDASPLIVAKTGRPASTPESRRMVVPEFPASSTPAGSARPRRPAPVTARAPPSARSSNRTPSSARHERVERQSPVASGRRISLVPSAMAAKRSARWVMDLSAGGAYAPPSPARRAWKVASMAESLAMGYSPVKYDRPAHPFEHV
jgi:hypothetical protein